MDKGKEASPPPYGVGRELTFRKKVQYFDRTYFPANGFTYMLSYQVVAGSLLLFL